MISLVAAIAFLHRSATLDVGEGKTYARIEDALAAALSGDEIDVYPNGAGYAGTALLIRMPGLKIVGKGAAIVIDGKSTDYTGVGKTPRAIMQVDADDVTIENFELKNARNRSNNGSGIRINCGSRVTVRNCSIHDNDMGIMSNGREGDSQAAAHQLIERCDIHHNGSVANPGFSHNLYLGGTSVTVQFCSIHDSTAGHNLKSRAHFARVQYNEIYNSSNRELDFVEAWDTHRQYSNVLLIGNVIRKNPDAVGNHGVLDFGAERGDRTGAIFLVNNTIETPFHSSVIDLTTPSVTAHLFNNVIENHHESHPILVGVENGASLASVVGGDNVISPAYSILGTGIDPQTLYTDTRRREFDPKSDRPPLPYLAVDTSYIDGAGHRQQVKCAFRHSRTKGWIPATGKHLGAGD